VKAFFKREGRLLLAAALLVVLMNVPYGRYVLYPFTIFSTWIHEMCHGLAAIALGGSIEHLSVFSDGSGLAYTIRPTGRIPTAIVASAGYVGTAVIGAGMLLVRNRRLAGAVGLGLLGAAMLLSTLLWVRNGFGIIATPILGAALLAATRAPAEWSGRLYTFLAVTCCLNAITSIRVLFGSNLVVAGKPAGSSDAQTVAEALFLPAPVWAASWMLLAVVLVAGALYSSRTPPRRS
jgi:hypothetical protein